MRGGDMIRSGTNSKDDAPHGNRHRCVFASRSRPRFSADRHEELRLLGVDPRIFVPEPILIAHLRGIQHAHSAAREIQFP
jgi:hypothetical protein